MQLIFHQAASELYFFKPLFTWVFFSFFLLELTAGLSSAQLVQSFPPSCNRSAQGFSFVPQKSFV